jgi:predicted nucleic acid-binding protein
VITAVDANVILDVLNDDPGHASGSSRAMQEALREGALMACDVVWAEVGAWYPSPEDAASVMDEFRIRFAAIDPEVAAAAGRVWLRYRQRGGGRDRMLPDFLIGAHAWMRADRFITRDRGFYREYFTPAKIVDPSAG